MENDKSNTSTVLVLWLIAATATIAPYWATTLPLSIDLPQHLAQVWLLDETIAGARTGLVVTPWYYPNTLVYWVLLGYWKLFPPLVAGRIMLSTLAIAWLTGSLALQHYRCRPIENWFIAAPIAFCFLFNWGLLNFLIGWPIFCAFLLVTSSPRFAGQTVVVGCVALLLYFAHALWFLMANAWLVASFANARKARALRLICSTLPTWLLAAVWYPKLADARNSSGIETGLLWGAMPSERLDFEKICNSMLGSITGAPEPVVTLVLLVWIAFGIATGLKYRDRDTDHPLLLAAVLMILGYWAFPETFMNTIFFNQRWLPIGITLLALALPAPPFGRAIAAPLGVACLIWLSVSTIQAWQDWEDEHLPGFFEALSSIDPNDRILALNLNDGSLYLKGRPGLHLFAYAQTLRHADIFFSFTEHYSGPVQFHPAPPPNRERALVSFPGLATAANTSGYTKVLISGNDTMQHHYEKKLKLVPIEQSAAGLWRLYRTSNQAKSAM